MRIAIRAALHPTIANLLPSCDAPSSIAFMYHARQRNVVERRDAPAGLTTIDRPPGESQAQAPPGSGVKSSTAESGTVNAARRAFVRMSTNESRQPRRSAHALRSSSSRVQNAMLPTPPPEIGDSDRRRRPPRMMLHLRLAVLPSRRSGRSSSRPPSGDMDTNGPTVVCRIPIDPVREHPSCSS